MIYKFLNRELLRSAWDGLITHKLRSGLTTLGVIFGVAAVISMSSIGEGARKEALKQIELMGASNIIIDESRPEDGEERVEAISKNIKGLCISDADALKEILVEAELIIPQRMANLQVTAGSQRSRLEIVASTPDQFQHLNVPITSGRPLTA